MKCSIEWCDRPASQRLCKGHQQRERTGVDMNKPWRTGSGQSCAASATCQRTGRPRNRGMCYRHYKSDQQRRQGTGDWAGYMPTDDVLAHIARLNAAGMTLYRIAKIAGLNPYGLRLLPTRQRIWRTNGEKILAVHPDGFYEFESSGFVPAIGSVRRLQALIALGYTQVELAQSLGLTDTWIYQTLHGRTTQVCMATAKGIDALFRELQMRIPPASPAATAARNRARKKGWTPPFSWDETTIDDPNARPDLGEKKKTDWHAEYKELREWGLTDTKIAERMNISLEALQVRLRRVGKAERSADQAAA